MQLSPTKIKQLESIASKFKVNPDLLVDVLLEVGLKKKGETKNEEIKKLTPEEKVKAIETEALSKGWRTEQLWNRPKYSRYDLMGVICFVDNKTIIGEVNEKYIGLIHEKLTRDPVINILEKKTTVPKIVYELCKRLEKKEG